MPTQNNIVLNDLNNVLSLISQQTSEDLLNVNPNTALPEAPEQHPQNIPWCEGLLQTLFSGEGELPFDEALAQSVELKACLCNENPQQALDLGIDCRVYNQVYFYHPDYVGSVEFITDLSGRVHQFYHYAPFGEVITSHNAQTGSLNVNFSFNGKEYDDESSLYYYGARYYTPELMVLSASGGWMSVDPLAHQFPHLTPYNFTENNPIMLWDPTGMGSEDPENKPVKTTNIIISGTVDENNTTHVIQTIVESNMQRQDDGTICISEIITETINQV